MKLAIAVALVSLMGCKEAGGDRTQTDRALIGHERGDCRADKTCDPGLWCLSNLCVRPPAADCQVVADVLASAELGNYAEPEDSAPVVAKYKDACEKQFVSKEEGACLDKVHDKWAAAQCVPRMFPELTPTGGNDCKLVSEKIKSFIEHTANYAQNPQVKKWFDASIGVVRESCEQDHWPDALKKCVLSTNAIQNPMYFQQCNQMVPAGLQQKMQERLTKAMQAQQP
jgi:hypothetical protein